MNTGRRSLSPAEEIALVAQVDNSCPRCGNALFYKKRGRSYKHYEVAHIYPLNPTDAEMVLLVDEERLGVDINDVDNLLPLCLGCHGKFDKPRTVAEYRDLLEKKKALLARDQRRSIQNEYQLQVDIASVVTALDENDFPPSIAELVLIAKPLEEKLNDTMLPQTRRKIHHNVNDYFVHVRQTFQRIDCEKPGATVLILAQVKAFYLAQRQLGWTQQEIFTSVVEWITRKTRPKSLEAVEVVASFFVQNCEVFE